uniref:DNA-directed RNA polymerase n=1 Tax=Chlorogonium capillatum TaxID=71743 RepID=A0A0S2ICU7_9CHLO|nr:alpha subunit of RNA polymerase [Chlorogonium capillatum]
MNKIFISCKESRIENNKSFYGCFYLGPFNEGESLTIANALRRTLLSECPGLAITSVLIEDVNHEYSTLSGVRDSVLDILLNLKEIVLKKSKNPWCSLLSSRSFRGANENGFSFFEQERETYKQKGVSSVYNQVGSFKPVVGYLKVKGPGIVRAKDLRLPPFIQCVDPDQYIATLSENGSLNMKFVIMEGKSYIIQKNNKNTLDYSFVKKRHILLKTLKELMMYRSLPRFKTPSLLFSNPLLHASKAGMARNLLPLPLPASVTPPKAGLGLKGGLKGGLEGGLEGQSERLETEGGVSVGRDIFIKKAGKQKQFTSLGVKEGEKLKGLPKGTLSSFKNASPLNIDAIFSPIKKVNYIIEISENKIVNKNNEKYSLTNNFYTLIESGDFYKTNFPFLTGTKEFYGVRGEILCEEKESGGDNIINKKSHVEYVEHVDAGREGKNALKQSFMQNLMEYVETYSTDELWNLSRSLHPLRKEGVLHTVILEIWTNGSLHPREALSMAFSHLTKLFMNLEKTKVFNPIYKNVSSYKKCLNTNIREASSKERVFLNMPVASLWPVPAEGQSLGSANKLISHDISLSAQNSEREARGTLASPFYIHESAWESEKFRSPAQTYETNEQDRTKKLDIGSLNLNLRAYTQLKRANIKTIGDLTAVSKKNLYEYYKLDNLSIKLINKSLEEFGLSLLKD